MDKKIAAKKFFKLWMQRKGDVAKPSSEALETPPKGALSIRKTWAARTKNVFVLYTAEEALSLFIEAHLTKINT